MKILEAFGEQIAEGGEEVFVFGVLENMTGMDIDCLTPYKCWSSQYSAFMKRRGGNIYALNLPFAPGKSRLNIMSPFQKFLKTHHYDIVHIHSSSISALAVMASAADKAGVKTVIVHSHLAGERENLKHRILRYIASISMRRHVDIYCACSKEAADWKFKQKYATRAHIIKNGVDTHKFRFNQDKRKEMRQKLGLENSFVIGHVGRFNRQKNHEFLIRIFKTLTDASLLLVGFGEEMDKIKDQVKGKNVIFTGSVNNVEDYLQAMDVFVFPSLYEGLPISTIEAQCSGLPVIVSDHISREIDLTDVTFLSLDDHPEKWGEAIQTYRGAERRDQSQIVKDKGYDMAATANVIKNMYLTAIRS